MAACKGTYAKRSSACTSPERGPPGLPPSAFAVAARGSGPFKGMSLLLRIFGRWYLLKA